MKAKLKPDALLLFKGNLLFTELSKKSSLKVSGEFQKNIILITDPLNANSKEKELLDKMLHATGLQLNDVFHIECAENKGYKKYINGVQAEKVISFGKQILGTNIDYSNILYKLHNINDYQLIITKSLSNIKDSSEDKQKLWNSLKIMFNIK